MEEILASIRRIIAEGERDAQEGGGQRDLPEPTAPPSSKPATAQNSEEAGHAEVLVLTEMVQDDGSVVSLQSPVASAPAQPDEASVDSLLRQSLLAEAAPSPPAPAAIAGRPTKARQSGVACDRFRASLCGLSRQASPGPPVERRRPRGPACLKIKSDCSLV